MRRSVRRNAVRLALFGAGCAFTGSLWTLEALHRCGFLRDPRA